MPPAQPHRSGQHAPAASARSERWDHGKHRHAGEARKQSPRINPLVEIFAHQPDTSADAEPTDQRDRDQKQTRRPALVARRRRLRDHAHIRVVDRPLLAGLARTREKGLIDRAARFDFTLQFAQPYGCLVGRDRVLLESVEIGLERFFARLRALKLAARRGCDTCQFLIDQFLQALNLRIEICHGRMARADQRAEFGALTRNLGILRAQLPDRLRQHRLRDRAGLGPGLACPDDLFIARARFRDFAARGIELQRHLAQLLLVHEYAAGRDDLVLLFVLHGAVFCRLQAGTQRVEPAAERIGRASRCRRARVRLVVKIGLRDRVSHAHGLFLAFRGDVDIDHIGLVGTLHPNAPFELAQCLEFGIPTIGCVKVDAKGCKLVAQFARESCRRAAEFRIGIEMRGDDRTAQHRIGGDDQKLALDHRNAAIRRQRLRRHLVGHDAPVAWVDQDLGGGRVERRCEKTVAKREQHRHGRRPQDGLAPAPQHLNELLEIDARVVSLWRGSYGRRVRNHVAERLGNSFLQHASPCGHSRHRCPATGTPGEPFWNTSTYAWTGHRNIGTKLPQGWPYARKARHRLTLFDPAWLIWFRNRPQDGDRESKAPRQGYRHISRALLDQLDYQ